MKTLNHAKIAWQSTILIVAVFCLLISNSFAGNYTWTGSSSNDWATSTNWSPNGVPSTGDSVTITAGSNNCLLAGNTTIDAFFMSDDTVDFSGYTLTVTTYMEITDGLIDNGTLLISGATASNFNGGILSVVLDLTADEINFSGTEFLDSVTAIKVGSANSVGTGGCRFSSIVNLTSTGSGFWTFATHDPDRWDDFVNLTVSGSGSVYFSHQSDANDFSKSVTFTNTSSGNIYCNYYGSSYFHDSIIVNATGPGYIAFGMGGGFSILDTSIITIGGLGLDSTSSLILDGILQQDTTKTIELIGTGSAAISFRPNSVFDGRVTVRAFDLELFGTHFNNVTSITHTGTNTRACRGGCFYGDSTFISHDNDREGAFFVGTDLTDTFVAPVTFRKADCGKMGLINGICTDEVTVFNDSISSTGVSPLGSTPSHSFLIADAGNCFFEDAVRLYSDTGSIAFGTNKGGVIFDRFSSLEIDSGFLGDLFLSNCDFQMEQETNFPFDNNPGLLTLDAGNYFQSAVTCHVQRIQMNASTFNGDFSLVKTGSQDDTCKGGNTFYGETIINDSCISSHQSLILARNNPDDFNGNVTFKQYGNCKLYPCYTANSTFSGNIYFDGDSTINFGYAGGRVVLDGENDHSFEKSGVNNVIIKKIEINKEAGIFSLNNPMMVSDSVIFTKGYLEADSVRPLIIPDNGVATGASDSSHVIGLVKKAGNDAFTFPLGAEGYYHPLSISAPSSAGDVFAAEYHYDDHGKGLNCDSAIENPSLCEYWKLEQYNGSSSITVGLGWNENSCNVFGLDSLSIGVWSEADSTWKDKGNGGTTGSLSVGSVVSDSVISQIGIITIADLFCTSLTLTPQVTDVSCPEYNNGKAKIIANWATPPYSYIWSPIPAGTPTLGGLAEGTYYFTVRDSRSCSLNDSIVIGGPDSIHLSISTTPSSCLDSNGTIKISPSGGDSTAYFYFWMPNGESADSVGGLPAGVYYLKVTDFIGCSIDTVISISDTNGPEASIEILNNVKCYGNDDASIQLNICPGCLPADPIPLCTDVVNNTERLAAGTYPIIVTDSSGCVTVASTTITEPAPLLLEVFTSKSDCGDSTGTALVIASGGTGAFTYSWSSGGTDSIETNLPSGFDTVTVTDANGCVAQSLVLVTDTNSLELSVSKEDVLCYDDSSTGSASISVSGGTSPYHYFWFNGLPDSASLTTLYRGEYSVLVTDTNGCKELAQFVIDSPNLPLLAQLFKIDPSTDSTYDGSATLEVRGGTPPYVFSWSPGGGTSPAISALGAGDYLVTVTDDNGCSRNLSFSLTAFSSCQGSVYSPDTRIFTNRDVLLPVAICTLDIVQHFGATPDDGISDEEAFEAANNYIVNFICTGLNCSGPFVLNFPAGTYDIGRQDFWGAPAPSFYRPGLPYCTNYQFFARGHDIFRLGEDAPCGSLGHEIIFQGEADANGNPLSILRFENCMRYGSFVPGEVPDTRYIPCGGFKLNCYRAEIGTLFSMGPYETRNVTIKDLELNGNSTNFYIGGGSAADAAGINGGHFGILMTNAFDVSIDNVDAHHFGYAALEVSPHYTMNDPLNLRLSDSKFNNNGCSGFAWESNSQVYAIRCDFDSNAMAPIRTLEGRGIDIETQSSPVRAAAHGDFYECNFRLNFHNGVGGHDDTGLLRNEETDYSFMKCVFVGSESGKLNLRHGNPVALINKRVHYTCCDFYGPINYIYDASVDAFQQNNIDETRFIHCSFNEEYEVDGTIYSFTPDCFTDCDPAHTTASVPYHQYMLALGSGAGVGVEYGRVFFNQCYFNTNYNNAICRLSGASRPSFTTLPHSVNFQVLKNCSFYNWGLNSFGGAYTCTGDFAYNLTGWNNRVLFQFGKVDFQGNNRLTYVRYNGCAMAYGNCRNSTASYSDYWWAVSDIAKNGSPSLFSVPPFLGIGGYFYDGACNPQFPHGSPFEEVDILGQGQIPPPFEPPRCRFENPESVELFLAAGCTTGIAPIPVDYCAIGYRIADSWKPEKKIDEATLSVSPVPSNNFVNIGNITAGDEIRLFDLIGNLLINTVAENSSKQLDISGLSSGIYILKVQGKKDEKIIKISMD